MKIKIRTLDEEYEFYNIIVIQERPTYVYFTSLTPIELDRLYNKYEKNGLPKSEILKLIVKI